MNDAGCRDTDLEDLGFRPTADPLSFTAEVASSTPPPKPIARMTNVVPTPAKKMRVCEVIRSLPTVHTLNLQDSCGGETFPSLSGCQWRQLLPHCLLVLFKGLALAISEQKLEPPVACK